MNALRLIPFLLVSLATSFAAAAGVDPNLWLEDIEGAKAIDWVKERNKTSLAELEGDKRYEPLRQEMRAILNAQDKIAWPSWRGGMIYNFWQDAEHVRGLWRRAALAEYRKKDPKWEIILDVDKLGRDENESWVYKGASCRAPLYTKCLLSLSRGGKDAVVVREFDAALSTFVRAASPFQAKHRRGWLSELLPSDAFARHLDQVRIRARSTGPEPPCLGPRRLRGARVRRVGRSRLLRERDRPLVMIQVVKTFFETSITA